MKTLVNYRDVVVIKTVVPLFQVVLVDTPIVQEVPVVAEVLPNLAAVFVVPAVVPVYVTAGVSAVVPKGGHVLKVRKSRLLFHICSC